MGFPMQEKTVFLDRDGVINRDSEFYIKCWEEFEFLPGSLDAIHLLTRNGFSIFIVTNQSAIGRKFMPMEELNRIHRNMQAAILEHGGKIRDIFFCPHLPEAACNCRKPKPGLIESATEKYNLDLNKAVLVGDSAKDILCAQNAGCGKSVLVLTGNGKKAIETLNAQNRPPTHVAADLLEAARWML